MISAPSITTTPLRQADPAQPPQRRRLLHGSRVIGSVLFVAVLFLPLVGMWRRWDPTGPSHEHRLLATRPMMPRDFKAATLYSDRWLDFFRDHFGFRNTLIRGVALAKFYGLGSDPSGRVVVGKDGWLFLRPEGDPNFIAFRGLNPFTEDQLDAWQRLLERRQGWLAAHGIPMLLVIPPDKETIYPEYLPDSLAPVRRQSHLDQIIDRLRRTHSPVHLVDLRPELLAAKSTGRIYFKTDTHWNDRGAYVGYRAIMKAVKDLLPGWNIAPQPRSNFVAESSLFREGDLARMMDMSGQYADESLSLRRKIPFPFPQVGTHPQRTTVTNVDDPALPRLVFYRDSYANALAPMIGPNFRHIFWSFNDGMDPGAIEREKPDLVIDEFLERNLYLPPPTDMPEIQHWKTR